MFKTRLLYGVVAVTVLALVAGCSSDKKSSTGPGNNNQAPQFNVTKVNIPAAMAQNNDPMAQTAVGYVNLANSYSNWVAFLTPPPSAPARRASIAGAQVDPWVYEWSDGDLDLKMIVSEEGDYYSWEVLLNGTDGQHTFDDFTLIDAEAHKTQSLGSMAVYDYNSGLALLDWNWMVDDDDIYSFVMNGYNPTINPPPITYQISVVSNPDLSGSIDYLLNVSNELEPAYRSEWQSTGAGEWWTYSNGEVFQNGTW